MSCDKAFEIASTSPSAVDMAAAIPPAATRPEITYGNPATSGVANTTALPPMKNSFNSSVPFPLKSLTNIRLAWFQFWYQSIACTSAIDLPIIPVGRFGSIKESFDKVANIGAEEYSRNIKNKDQPTDLLAAFTLGVVKYLIITWGNEAVPAIIQTANEINFQGVVLTSEWALVIPAKPFGTVAKSAAEFLIVPRPNWFSSSAILATSSANIKCGKKPAPILLLIQNTGIKYAIINTMYWATWVQVTALIPPSIEHINILAKPTYTAILKGISSATDAIVPVALIWAVTYVNEATVKTITADNLAMFPPYLVPIKSGTV